MGIMDTGIRHRNLALESFRNLADIEKSRQSYELRYQQEKEQLEAAEDAQRSNNVGKLTVLGGIGGWKAAPKVAEWLGPSALERTAEKSLGESTGAFLTGKNVGSFGLTEALKDTAKSTLASSVSPGLLSGGGTTAALSEAVPAAVTTAQSLAPAIGATEIGGPAAELFGTGLTEAIGAGSTIAGTEIGAGTGAATGAMEGQMAIPIPLVGAAVGAGLGMLFGSIF